MVKHGTTVYYISGNHDEFLREFIPQKFGNIIVEDEVEYTCKDGNKLIVVHGDMFDSLTKHLTWAYHLGDKGYSLVLRINEWLNYIRRKFGLQYWSLSKMIKKKFKEAVNYINGFEHLVAKYAVQKNCQGVICGHIHHPIIKNIEIDGKNIKYYNCGDWVESCTAIIEYDNGDMKLIQF